MRDGLVEEDARRAAAYGLTWIWGITKRRAVDVHRCERGRPLLPIKNDRRWGTATEGSG